MLVLEFHNMKIVATNGKKLLNFLRICDAFNVVFMYFPQAN